LSKAPLISYKCGPSEKRDENYHVLANSRREMLLKAVGQLLSTAKRVKESCWEMPKYLLSAHRRGGRIAQ
jgi:hypothetical protein